ncbi:MAG: arginine--tRNA ligase [Nitrospinae bacterium]|nr:arginine--tRNA ligase [Nitrospinota bacterium]MBF0634163.1 arginine--tRNA ligase [Nitrospinota bacterium]
MRQVAKRIASEAFARASAENGWNETAGISIDITTPKEEKFGDFSCNVAMILASRLKSNPRAIAEKVAEQMRGDEIVANVEVAGPGFINMTLKPSAWASALGEVFTAKDGFGKTNDGNGKKVIVEFVSANPTGPLHIGHGRGAAFGDSLARVLKFAGYAVHREYYINDVGLQMDNLGRSTLERAREVHGLPFGEPAYKGEYMKDIAREFLAREGDGVLNLPPEEALARSRAFTAGSILDGIRHDLAEFRVGFDEWFSEESMHKAGSVNNLIDLLLKSGHIYENEGALWLKTDDSGDDKDRVVKRANGPTTYLAADIAYHKDKLDRGFDIMVDVWGADHHGYISRLKAVIAALGADPDRLATRLVQIVNLKRGGELIAMSTRSGVFTTLREIMDEVGVDATRFFFNMRSADSQMDFDVDLAKKQSDENPVYYIQYAHARCANIFVTALDKGFAKSASPENEPLSQLERPAELKLVKKLLKFPDVVSSCASALHVHPVASYLLDLAGVFHNYYKHNRVVTEDAELTRARLVLVDAARMVFRSGLDLLGVSAPERM